MGIIVIGTAFVDIKGFPDGAYIPDGRNVGQVRYIHGGVARNVVEDIANMELRPIYVGMVDDTPLGTDVLEKLKRHKINTDYVLVRPDGMGLWLAVFDSSGDVAGSISKRPDAYPIYHLLCEKAMRSSARAIRWCCRSIFIRTSSKKRWSWLKSMSSRPSLWSPT